MANEKVITTAALIEKFKQALAEKWGYIWGTAGETWTAARQAQLEKTTDADRANSRKYGSKWIGHKVADCSGLFSWAFKQLGGYMYHGSDTMFRKYCTKTGELKNGHPAGGGILPVGVAVFTYNKDKKKYGHVGLYIGGGFVIEARGAYYGVVMTKIESRPWVAWGELKGVDYSNETPAPAPEPTPEPVKKPTIRKGNRNAYVKEMQTILRDLGYNLGICGVDGDFGTATEAALKAFQKDHDGPDGKALAIDGICGPATWWALQEALGENKKEPAKKYTLIISGLDKTQAEAIRAVAANYPDAVIKEE